MRAIDLDADLVTAIHPERLRRLSQEGAQLTAQHLTSLNPVRRRAVLVATAIETQVTLTDDAVRMFERLFGQLFRRAERREDAALKRDRRTITAKIRLLAKLGEAVMTARNDDADPLAAIESVVSWDELARPIDEARRLIRPDPLDPVELSRPNAPILRQVGPAFVAAFTFGAVPACASLARAVATMRDLGSLDRRTFEFCVLAELRDRLRAGDMWVEGSRRYRAVEQQLIPAPVFAAMRDAGPLPVPVADTAATSARLAVGMAPARGQLWRGAGEAGRGAAPDAGSPRCSAPAPCPARTDSISRSTGARRRAARSIRTRAASPRVSFYTHVSDRYAPFHSTVISASAGEAAHVLDGLLHHGADLSIERHHTDGGGVSDHVFALCHLLDFRFAPRIPNIAARRLHLFADMRPGPDIAPLAAQPIDEGLIAGHWNDVIRLAASIRAGVTSAAVMLERLGSYPRANGLALALREIGRVERTCSPSTGSSGPRNDVARPASGTRARRRTPSSARSSSIAPAGSATMACKPRGHRASALNLVAGAIVLWNTTYLEAVMHHLERQGRPVPSDLLQHLSPLGWQHINLTGDYIRSNTETPQEKLRPLRQALRSPA